MDSEEVQGARVGDSSRARICHYPSKEHAQNVGTCQECRGDAEVCSRNVSVASEVHKHYDIMRLCKPKRD